MGLKHGETLTERVESYKDDGYTETEARRETALDVVRVYGLE